MRLRVRLWGVCCSRFIFLFVSFLNLAAFHPYPLEYFCTRPFLATFWDPDDKASSLCPGSRVRRLFVSLRLYPPGGCDQVTPAVPLTPGSQNRYLGLSTLSSCWCQTSHFTIRCLKKKEHKYYVQRTFFGIRHLSYQFAVTQPPLTLPGRLPVRAEGRPQAALPWQGSRSGRWRASASI